METVVIVVHLMVVLALVGVVLLQRSEGGGLGIGGGSGFMTARGAANALTRATAILAVAFFATSLALSIIARYGAQPTRYPGSRTCNPGRPERRRRSRPARRFRRSRAAGYGSACGRDIPDECRAGCSDAAPASPPADNAAPAAPAPPAEPQVPNQ